MFGYVTKRAEPPPLTVKGTNLAPTHHPVALVQLRQGIASYETLYTDLDATGQPLGVVYGGSWGVLVPAGRR